MENQSGSFEAANTLAWLVSAGADVIVDEKPRNWLEQPAASTQPKVHAPATAAARIDPAPRARLNTAADDLAATATDLLALDTAISTFTHPLRQAGAPQLLSGNAASGILVIIDQPPGENTPASVLMARMMAAIGLDAGNCATAHMLPWQTPAARAPRDDEITAFAPFLRRVLMLAQPRLILALGDKASALADRPAGAAARGIASMRGKWLMIGTVPVMATFHPSQLLTQPELKKLAWADLQAFQEQVKPS